MFALFSNRRSRLDKAKLEHVRVASRRLFSERKKRLDCRQQRNFSRDRRRRKKLETNAPTLPKTRIRDVYFTDEQTGWLLCESNIFNLGANSPSYLMKTTDGGANWEQVEFGEGREAHHAKSFSRKAATATRSANAGAFFTMQDDKKSWKKTPSPSRYLLLDGIFTDDSHGAIVGAGGTILFTEDAGLTLEQGDRFRKIECETQLGFFHQSENRLGGRRKRENLSNLERRKILARAKIKRQQRFNGRFFHQHGGRLGGRRRRRDFTHAHGGKRLDAGQIKRQPQTRKNFLRR